MIVVDASAALSALLNAGPARRAVAAEQLHVPHLIDAEIANAVRGRVAARKMSESTGWRLLDAWRRLAMTRYPTFTLLARGWQLHDNLSSYDASYVALAEYLDCPLLSADGRRSRAPGLRCSVTVAPH